ncbi:MAG: isocitrate lyase/PEP mutase family protein [Betaproteobacteria bacterium]|nr:isocitrate lyase/PEP mutase family protein [Betaproteobacteria bacterium]
MAGSKSLTPTEKRLRFREVINRKALSVMPGGFSPAYARMAELAGFECFFLAGSQMSAFLVGVPDNGILGLRDVVDHARHMARVTPMPILVDADTGFGNAVNVHYTVQEMVNAGVAGLQIEDQEAPKKSGTGAGRRCISIEENVGKLKSAVAARNELDPSFVICARTDSLGSEGGSFEDAVKRCIAYANEGGADIVWLNSIRSLDQIEEAARRSPVPLLCSWGGSKPTPSLDEFEKRGLRILLHPTIAASAGMQAAWQLLHDMKARGSQAINDWAEGVAKQSAGPADLKKLFNADKIRQIEDLCLPEAARRDYVNTSGGHTPLGKK